MKFLIDQNLSPELAARFVEAGHERVRASGVRRSEVGKDRVDVQGERGDANEAE